MYTNRYEINVNIISYVSPLRNTELDKEGIKKWMDDGMCWAA